MRCWSCATLAVLPGMPPLLSTGRCCAACKLVAPTLLTHTSSCVGPGGGSSSACRAPPTPLKVRCFPTGGRSASALHCDRPVNRDRGNPRLRPMLMQPGPRTCARIPPRQSQDAVHDVCSLLHALPDMPEFRVQGLGFMPGAPCACISGCLRLAEPQPAKQHPEAHQKGLQGAGCSASLLPLLLSRAAGSRVAVLS